jgi:hypothetical protein
MSDGDSSTLRGGSACWRRGLDVTGEDGLAPGLIINVSMLVKKSVSAL